MKGGAAKLSRTAVSLAVLCSYVVAFAQADSTPGNIYKRTFHESAATIQKILQQMRGSMAGRLPVLDGFATAGNHPLDRYQRAYFQATAQVSSGPNGETVVCVTTKVTAWHRDPEASRSGYQLLTSNGRIETDILDQLSDQVAALSPAPTSPSQKPASTSQSDDSSPALASAPMPRPPDFHSFSSPLSQDIPGQENAAPSATAQNNQSPQQSRLQAELEQLREILKNQAHPKNLVAVKKSGTAVVPTPSLTAKPIFLASAHDEFEMLNFNQDWVHVRISGLSRGWIWRNALEMPGDIPDTQSESGSGSAGDLFHIVREETAPFPGDWEPLRGKSVKLISVQKADEESKASSPQMKLEFAKALFEKNYSELAQKSTTLAGIVLIFDSVDGGMVAVPESTLAKWKAGTLSDAALWHACFFDPPETFLSSASSASR